MRSPRWPLVVTLIAATATFVLLGVATTQTEAGRSRTLLLFGLVAFGASVAAGGAWAIAFRRVAGDPMIERADTASKLAHELRNPLMSIKGLASTGARLFEEMEDDERREFFRLIEEEAARLKRVAEQSATALRADAGQITYDLREEDLGALVEEVAWSTPRAEHPMSIESETGINAEVDRTHLAEAVANLIDNASKYSPPDAPIAVTVRRAKGGETLIEVADRGPGIPPERRGAVFERFARWRPAGYEETPGAGLGLFIARAHVLAHGGRVEALEREDGGMILRITLPVEG